MERVDDPGGHEVTDGLDPTVDEEALSGLLDRAGREVDAGLLPACQVAVAHRGRLLATRTYGAPPTSRFLLYSCTKAITAGAVWRLLGDGLLATDTPVAEVVPRFAEGGKGGVTVEHLLTHTAGFPSAQMPAADWVDHDRRLDRLAAWPLEWEPGQPLRVPPGVGALGPGRADGSGDGRSTSVSFVRTVVLDPLGLDTLRLGLAPDEQDDVLDVVGVGEEPSEEELARPRRRRPGSTCRPSARPRTTCSGTTTRRSGPSASPAAARWAGPPTWPCTTRRSVRPRRDLDTRRVGGRHRRGALRRWSTR